MSDCAESPLSHKISYNLKDRIISTTKAFNDSACVPASGGVMGMDLSSQAGYVSHSRDYGSSGNIDATVVRNTVSWLKDQDPEMLARLNLPDFKTSDIEGDQHAPSADRIADVLNVRSKLGPDNFDLLMNMAVDNAKEYVVNQFLQQALNGAGYKKLGYDFTVFQQETDGGGKIVVNVGRGNMQVGDPTKDPSRRDISQNISSVEGYAHEGYAAKTVANIKVGITF